jgi:hypothetical protein
VKLIQDLPRINSPAAAWRCLRLLGQALWSVWHWWRTPERALAAPSGDPADTLVLVTLDGVRLKELFEHPSAMPYMMGQLVPRGTFIGRDQHPPDFRIGSPVGVSMSGYYSIFSGKLTGALENEAPPPQGATLISDLVAAFPGQVALFSTWDLIVQRQQQIAPGVEAVAGRGAALAALHKVGVDLPEDVPVDTPVFRAALDRLRHDPPRFLYIGLDETDDAAHRNDYKRYLNVLSRYDGFLSALVAEIDAQAARGRKVSLVVTTDHGRGVGEEWVEHRWNIEGTARIWLLALGHGVAAQGHIRPPRQRTQYDVRPTIGHLLGVASVPAKRAGAVMAELLSR